MEDTNVQQSNRHAQLVARLKEASQAYADLMSEEAFLNSTHRLKESIASMRPMWIVQTVVCLCSALLLDAAAAYGVCAMRGKSGWQEPGVLTLGLAVVFCLAVVMTAQAVMFFLLHVRERSFRKKTLKGFQELIERLEWDIQEHMRSNAEAFSVLPERFRNAEAAAALAEAAPAGRAETIEEAVAFFDGQEEAAEKDGSKRKDI